MANGTETVTPLAPSTESLDEIKDAIIQLQRVVQSLETRLIELESGD